MANQMLTRHIRCFEILYFILMILRIQGILALPVALPQDRKSFNIYRPIFSISNSTLAKFQCHQKDLLRREAKTHRYRLPRSWGIEPMFSHYMKLNICLLFFGCEFHHQRRPFAHYFKLLKVYKPCLSC